MINEGGVDKRSRWAMIKGDTRERQTVSGPQSPKWQPNSLPRSIRSADKGAELYKPMPGMPPRGDERAFYALPQGWWTGKSRRGDLKARISDIA